MTEFGELAKLNLQGLAPAHPKRMVHILHVASSHLTHEVNVFATKCEARLLRLERHIASVELLLATLESKLASVDWLEPDQFDTEPLQEGVTEGSLDLAASSECVDSMTSLEQQSDVIEDENVSSHASKEEVDPAYEPFLRRLKIGAPEQQLVLDLQAQGLDPDEFRRLKGMR